MKTILLLDDRPDNSAVLVAILAHRGYRLLESENGVEGLQIVRREKPDLIIADILMPKMDGYEFVQQLRLDASIAHTPVIFFTANYIEKEAWDLARACGVQHILVKPAEPKEVLRIVDEALAARGPGPGVVPGPEFVHEHLHLVTDKLAQKVYELERLNAELGEEVEERKQIEAELRVTHRAACAAREEAEHANHAKDNFLAALSHELRTPLTPVLLCASALEEEEIAPPFREQLAMIRRNIELEARLIDDLLDLTRIARGQMQLVQSGPIDLHSLLLHTKEIVGFEARQKSIQLHFELTAREHTVGGDAARLHQVFWNVIKNAIKFTPGQGQVTVRSANPAPGRFVVTVEDTGSGIEPAQLPDIFHAFERKDALPSTPSGGLGIGLSISRAIVELHGGSIRAASGGPGQGAIFTVELDTVPPFQPAGDGGAEPETATISRRLRLLVVEDDEPTMDVLSGLLRRHGHAVFAAGTARDALLLAATHVFDLVISDLGLPDGSGIDLMRRLSQEYGLRGIALSGYGMPEDHIKSQKAGFLKLLVKPINFDQLNRVLREIASPGGPAQSEITG